MSSPKSHPTRPATVLYDTGRPPSSSSSTSSIGLAPPNLDEVYHRRHPWRRSLHLELPRRVQLPLTCLSIAVSSIQSNGGSVWPTYGPVVAQRLELSAAQTQTIVVGGILGVYLMAAPLGALTDRLGPRFGSLMSAALAAIGYFTFATLLSTQAPGTPYIHLYLTGAFFCVGAATVGSYFAALTCASLSFPSHPTIAMSLPLSLMGLSSLFLSSFSSLPTFSTPTGELNPTRFILFLGIFSPCVNLFSALFMRVIPRPYVSLDTPRSPLSERLRLDEHTPLLIGGMEAAREEVEAMERGKKVEWTAWGLVKDWEGFWAFGIVLALCIGPAETVIASIGSILTSLLPPTTSTTFPIFTPLNLLSLAPLNALSLRNKHVRIISLTSTVARLLTGLSADYLSPPLIAIPNPRYNPEESEDDAPEHLFIRKRKVLLNRSALAAIMAFFLGMVFAYTAGLLGTESGLWVLSFGVGSMYGGLFTLTPAIVSAHFGPTNFGLAWGMVSYFSALGSVLYSYLYAWLSVAVAERDVGQGFKNTEPVIQCYGARCFQPTFWVGAGCCVISSIGLFWLGRRWRV